MNQTTTTGAVSLRERLWETEAHSCHYCHVEFLYVSDATADHIVPKSNGGGNVLWNLVLACAFCNGAKGSTEPTCGCARCLFAVQHKGKYPKRERTALKVMSDRAWIALPDIERESSSKDSERVARRKARQAARQEANRRAWASLANTEIRRAAKQRGT